MDVRASFDEPADEAAHRRRRILAIIGGSSGNMVEWYDFYVYSFTSLYFAASFFPSGNRTSQLLAAAGVFAAGFLVRPVGGWVFGRLAGRRGRRFSMMASILLMCFGGLTIVVLPTHASIGALAPVLLTMARLAQGHSVGGKYGTSATYMSEVAVAGRRGFYASFQYVTLFGGQLLAVLVIVLLEALLSAEQMRAWGWRIPFVIGAAAAVVSLFLRRALHETQRADKATRKEAGSLGALLRDHPKPLLLVLRLTAGGSRSFYVFFGGTAEHVGLWFKSAGMEAGFFWYVTGFFVLAFLTAWAMPETRSESHLSREYGMAGRRPGGGVA